MNERAHGCMAWGKDVQWDPGEVGHVVTEAVVGWWDSAAR